MMKQTHILLIATLGAFSASAWAAKPVSADGSLPNRGGPLVVESASGGMKGKPEVVMQKLIERFADRDIGVRNTPGCGPSPTVRCIIETGGQGGGGGGSQLLDPQLETVARVCVQDSAFCQDANLKRVIDRNSIINEVQIYADN